MSDVDDTITSLLSEKRVFEPPNDGRDVAAVGDLASYERVYRRSMDDPEGFWAERAEELVSWFTPWKRVLDADLTKPEVRWFDGATLNVSFNCLDRHLA
ncbi:MAG: acetyl-coenzyme A synthetase, partial [Desulfofustis sp.]|nr:acetyl-coenzyme A synthetase [Desulfofustis sp.]